MRLGGIYALERIANDSDKDYWPIMETLTAYVRERVPWREPSSVPPEKALVEEPISPQSRSPAPTPKARHGYPGDPHRPGPAQVPLRARREYAIGFAPNRPSWGGLHGSHLEGAILIGAHMEGADFLLANLEGAFLPGAFLQGANLSLTNLNRAILMKAHLEGADLSTAIGLTTDQLSEAIIDEKTRLPDYLREEPPEAMGPEGNDEE